MDDTIQSTSNGSTTFKESCWRLWCRLCAKDNGNVNDEKKLQKPQLVNKNFLVAVETHFGVQVTQDHLPLNICLECISLISSLIKFNSRIQRVQEMYSFLHSANNEGNLTLYEVREKYDLLDDHMHTIDQEPSKQKVNQSEVHYFESKPNANFLEEMGFKQALMKLKANEENDRDIDKVIREENDYEVADEFERELDSDAYLHNGLNIDEVCDPINEDVGVRKQDIIVPYEKGNEYGELVREETLNSIEPLEMPKSNSKNKEAKKSDIVGLLPVYCCHECPRQFKLIQHYRQHMKRTHSQLAPNLKLQCLQCSRSFATKYQLGKHSKVHLPIELKKVLPCPYCEKKFTSNNLVRSHIKHIHMNERPFICEECGVAVRTNAALKTHMLTHTDYAPFECVVCQKSFKNLIRLKNHMETHDPNKHICAECGLQLNSRATLNRHLLVHSDKMSHKCDYCGRAFKRAKALKNHLILHTGLKPYSCDFCERTFANGSNCRSHKKKAHPEQLAALEACGGRTYTKNIPKLAALKAVTKDADNLTPVVSKKSGRFANKSSPQTSIDNPAHKIFETMSKPSVTNLQ